MKTIRFLLVADYYLAALLLVWAGVVKLRSPGVGDLLESLLEQEILSVDQLIFIARWYPPLEIILGATALLGVRAGVFARVIGSLYLFFTLLLLYVSQGYLLLPIDCGCFGAGDTTPVFLLILRNLAIALPLFFLPRSLGENTRPSLLFTKNKC